MTVRDVARPVALANANARELFAARGRLAAVSWGRWIILIALALAFQGTRGLWEPDEGFYANAALGMLESGDYLVPRLNGEPFLDKPPLVYWVEATGALFLGRTEWGLRFGHALLFVASALLAGAAARRLSDSRLGLDASLLYATLPLSYFAASVLTPDTPLAFGLALALYGLIRLESKPAAESSRLAWLLTGLGFGVALLAKGPVALAFAAAALVHRALGGRLRTTLRDGWAWVGAALALLPAIAWYGVISVRLPGAAGYLLDQQIIGRLLSAHLERNPGWTGALRVYLPTLVIGLAPWGVYAARRLGQALPRAWSGRQSDSPGSRVELLLVLWILLPLAVFVAASSRLPFYLLPLASPTAILAQLALADRPRWSGAASRVPIRLLAAAALALVALKASASYREDYRDSRGMARALAAVLPPSVHRVISVDVNRNGLALYLPGGVEWVTRDPTPYPFYSRLESFDEEVAEVASCPGAHALIVSPRDLQEVLSALVGAGQSCRVATFTRHNPVLFCESVRPPESAEILH